MTATAQVKIHRSTLNKIGESPAGFEEWLKETGKCEIIEDVDEVKKDD